MLTSKLQACCEKEWTREQQHPFVKVFYADKVGVGKTFQIEKEAKAGYQRMRVDGTIKSVPITSHCKDADAIISGLEKADHFHVDGEPRAFHLNMSGNVHAVVDVLLFQLLLMEDLVDSSGRHYRPSQHDAFFIEVPSEHANIADDGVPIVDKLSFCLLLPSVKVDMTLPPQATAPYNFMYDCTSTEARLVCQYLRALQRGEMMGQRGGKGNGFIAATWEDKCVVSWNHLPHMSQQECYDVLRVYAPQTPAHENGQFVRKSVLDESMIMTRNYVRYLYGMLRLIDDNVAKFAGFADNTLRYLDKLDFKQKMIENMMELSKDISGRSISPNSLLPEQAKAMGLEVSGEKNFGLTDGWATRPLILPSSGKVLHFQLLCLDPTTVPKDVKRYWEEGYGPGMRDVNTFKFIDYREASQEVLVKLLCDRLG